VDPAAVQALIDAGIRCRGCLSRVELGARVCPHCQRDPMTGNRRWFT
jgi:RNA polymerase subunit RPABC4/transcription elongation factor Spt4